MTKTIEELAKQYAEDMCPVGDYCGGIYDEQRHNDLPIYTDDAKSVLGWLFDKSLASRLTDAERELVVNTYNKTREWLNLPQEYYNNGIKLVATALQTIFEEIFGKELFEKEG